MALYMPLFKSCATLRNITQLHGHLVVNALHRDQLASTKLIESYAKLGRLQSAKLIFDSFSKPDSFMHGVLIKSYVWNSLFGEAISLYNDMLHNEAPINGFIFPSILRAISGFGNLGIGRNVHARLIKCGFDSDTIAETSLQFMYGEMRCLDDARTVFDEMSVRDVVSWSSLISSYIQNGHSIEGLKIFSSMVTENVKPDSVIMLSIAEACTELGSSRITRSVHGYILRQDIETNGSLGNSLITMYSKNGDLFSSEQLFNTITSPNISSWTAMISSYNQYGLFREALSIFCDMMEAKAEPNEVTMMSVLGSCAGLGLRNEGKSVHGYIIRNCIDSDLGFLGPTLIELYGNIGELNNSKKVLRMIKLEKSLVSWNMLISVLAKKGLLNDALKLFEDMLKLGLSPDVYTLSSALSISANIGSSHLGHQIHSHIIKTGISNEFVNNSLIDMYSKCGYVHKAYFIFDKIQQKSVVAWNSMICGFCQNGNSEEALHLFDRMYLNSLEMNEVTFLSVIQACSNIGYQKRGIWVHHKIIVYGVEKDTFIESALVDMYAKCGDLKMAQKVFDNMLERSIVSWSAMIGAYGMHGKIDAAISLFTQMLNSGTKPNEITFMNVLSACGHAGSVHEGKLYFNMMQDYGIAPNSEHYACMIDLLSRAGDLEGAYKIIKSMPFLPHASLWGAIVNGCRIHQRMDMIKTIEINLLDVDTDDTGYYTLLSNIYAEGENWDEFRKVRSKIKSEGLRKVPGYSLIEIGNRSYRFGAGLRTREVSRILEDLQKLSLEQDVNVVNEISMIDNGKFSFDCICV